MKPLQSHFQSYIEDMIKHKAVMGYSPSTYEYHLYKFDEYCYIHFPNETSLTKGLIESWARISEGETVNSFRRRLSTVREFSKYLQSIGLSAYILPDKMAPKQTRYIPHIFTERELSTFFYGADHFSGFADDPLCEYIVPVIYRVIYCCGLRPTEGRLIKTEDVNFETGRIYIREAKRHKDRIVVLSDDVISLCRTYNHVREAIYGKTEYFFPDRYGQARNKQWLICQFQKCWQISGMSEFAKPKPRVYDFRHTFATKKIHDWLDDGGDFYSFLPYLSTYMGHSNYSTTAYYVHMLPERLKNSPSIDWQTFAKLLPEVPV